MRFVDFKNEVPDRKINANYKVRHEDGTETNQYWNGRGFINFETSTWNYFSDIVGWYDPTPASAEEEAARMYPYDYENYDKEDHERVKAIRDAMRLAHIRCAGMYTGEIEKGREAIDILKALCALKRHKDTVGKDEYYEKAQPEVWKIANKFLEKL